MTKTSIEWTDASWNVLRGCARVSAGCENCYAENVARRFSGPGMPYEGLVRLTKDGKAKAQWSGEVRFIAEKLAEPLTWRKPKRVFVNSMSDLFHPGVSFEQIAAIFGVMAACPQHTFQALTKRPERARAFFEWLRVFSNHATKPETCRGFAGDEVIDVHGPTSSQMQSLMGYDDQAWPLANVWLGVSVEDQASADKRIPHLLECPAAVRWASYEPAIEAVDLRRYMWPVCYSWPSPFNSPKEARAAGAEVRASRQRMVWAELKFLDWVVVGGESGPGARPFDLSWARSVIAQCAEAGTACFVKQLGAHPVDPSRSSVVDNLGTVMPSVAHEYAEQWAPKYDGGRVVRPAPVRLKDRKGGDMSEFPPDLQRREWPR